MIFKEEKLRLVGYKPTFGSREKSSFHKITIIEADCNISLDTRLTLMLRKLVL